MTEEESSGITSLWTTMVMECNLVLLYIILRKLLRVRPVDPSTVSTRVTKLWMDEKKSMDWCAERALTFWKKKIIISHDISKVGHQ